MTTDKLIELHEDPSNIDDEYVILNYMKKNKVGGLYRGHVKIYTDTGECILEKDNMIVRRGRTFALEKIFDLPSGSAINAAYNTDSLEDKKVCLFTCGSGGAKAGLPFSVNADIDSDAMSLNIPIPFKLYEEGRQEDGYYMIREYPEGEKIPYYVDETVTDPQTGQDTVQQVTKYKNPKAYYAKEFKVLQYGKGDVEANGVGDEVYIQLELEINADDFQTIVTTEHGRRVITRAESISEIGLLIADKNMSDNSIELFSKINFPSEPMMNPTKTLTIHYYIYA